MEIENKVGTTNIQAPDCTEKLFFSIDPSVDQDFRDSDNLKTGAQATWPQRSNNNLRWT